MGTGTISVPSYRSISGKQLNGIANGCVQLMIIAKVVIASRDNTMDIFKVDLLAISKLISKLIIIY
jgi:hypothetical protein